MVIVSTLQDVVDIGVFNTSLGSTDYVEGCIHRNKQAIFKIGLRQLENGVYPAAVQSQLIDFPLKGVEICEKIYKTVYNFAHAVGLVQHDSAHNMPALHLLRPCKEDKTIILKCRAPHPGQYPGHAHVQGFLVQFITGFVQDLYFGKAILPVTFQNQLRAEGFQRFGNEFEG